jgi:hypothetical protein
MEDCPLKEAIDEWLNGTVKPALLHAEGEYRIAVYRANRVVRNELIIKVSKGIAYLIDGFEYTGPLDETTIATYVCECVKKWMGGVVEGSKEA